jgi:hypothetical protein
MAVIMLGTKKLQRSVWQIVKNELDEMIPYATRRPTNSLVKIRAPNYYTCSCHSYCSTCMKTQLHGNLQMEV